MCLVACTTGGIADNACDPIPHGSRPELDESASPWRTRRRHTPGRALRWDDLGPMAPVVILSVCQPGLRGSTPLVMPTEKSERKQAPYPARSRSVEYTTAPLSLHAFFVSMSESIAFTQSHERLLDLWNHVQFHRRHLEAFRLGTLGCLNGVI